MLQRTEWTKGPERKQIPRVRGAEIPAALAQYRREQRAVILEGAATDWAAVRRWSPDYLAEIVGDIQVTPSVGLPDAEVPYLYRDRDFRKPMTIREFVDLMRTGDRCYVDQVPMDQLPGLDHDVDFASLAPPDVKVVILWMGASTRSGMHYDFVDNLFAQVHGTKLVILAPPEEARLLHPFSDCHTKSQVAPEHPDLAAHPRFARANITQDTLQPGDVLFLPRGWWHYMASSESSISLTCWHGESLGPRDDFGMMLRLRDPKVWALLVRDFVWHGALKRPRPTRLFSPPSTGEMLYQLASSVWARRKTPEKKTTN